MKKKRSSFFLTLFVVLAVLGTLVFGAYLILDKLVVPKYFGEYGIGNMHDLVAMVKTLYNSPDEKELITNGFQPSDERSAVRKLISAGLPKISDSELDYNAIAEGVDESELVSGNYYFTDRELASILDQMLKSGILANKLPNIKYLNTININILELKILPEKAEDGSYKRDKAAVSFTFKLDTSSVKDQMASAMGMPTFLLNMIVPNMLYITVDYTIEKDIAGEWSFASGKLAVNGRTAKDSEILLNLLIEFMFTEEDEMTIDKLTGECGNILVVGMGLIGDTDVHTFEPGKTYGIVLSI